MTSTASSLSDENQQSSQIISFIQSQKGKHLLTLGKHIFKLNKSTENRKYWICTVKRCTAGIHTNSNNESI